LSRYIPDRPNSNATLLAAATWRDRCLVEDRSVLSDAFLWTPALLEELNERFNNQLDTSKDRFQVKLKRQLAEALPSASKLAAEMLWVMSLFPSNIGPDAKWEAVSDAWSWSGEALAQDHPMLDRELLRGFGSAGPGFLAHRPRELRFLINAMRSFKSKDAEQRSALLADSCEFATWLDGIPDEGYRQLKHILPFLLFPDDFERIAGPGDIRRILVGLGGIRRDELRRMSKVEQDKAMRNLRRSLENDSAEPIDFYQPALRQIWAPSEPEPSEADASATAVRTEIFEGSAALPLNLILYGPPGTGKTYKTVDRALQILDPVFSNENGGDREALKARFDELVEAGTVRFVTFHQSFSYEDFVEGLRAEARPDGSIHYYVAEACLRRSAAHWS
jgi:5-methylcytosine-specific restriction enzyme B